MSDITIEYKITHTEEIDYEGNINVYYKCFIKHNIWDGLFSFLNIVSPQWGGLRKSSGGSGAISYYDTTAERFSNKEEVERCFDIYIDERKKNTKSFTVKIIRHEFVKL